jgi:hypothetical protein
MVQALLSANNGIYDWKWVIAKVEKGLIYGAIDSCLVVEG